VLAEFLREIKYIAMVQEKQTELERTKRDAKELGRRGSKLTMDSTVTDQEEAIEFEDDASHPDAAEAQTEGEDNEWEGEGSGAWVPGQGVYVDHAAIMDIVIQHLSYPGKSTILYDRSRR
jgi:vacuole morphology and inheritance protein 14